MIANWLTLPLCALNELGVNVDARDAVRSEALGCEAEAATLAVAGGYRD